MNSWERLHVLRRLAADSQAACPVCPAVAPRLLEFHVRHIHYYFHDRQMLQAEFSTRDYKQALFLVLYALHQIIGQCLLRIKLSNV